MSVCMSIDNPSWQCTCIQFWNCLVRMNLTECSWKEKTRHVEEKNKQSSYLIGTQDGRRERASRIRVLACGQRFALLIRLERWLTCCTRREGMSCDLQDGADMSDRLCDIEWDLPLWLPSIFSDSSSVKRETLPSCTSAGVTQSTIDVP